MVRVTRTAVSVVICMGPSLLVGNPFSRSSDVLSIWLLGCRLPRTKHGEDSYLAVDRPLPFHVSVHPARLDPSCEEGLVPRIPPNKKPRNRGPSSGLSSVVAAGSRRHMRFLSASHHSSTPDSFNSNLFLSWSSAGNFRCLETEERQKTAPASFVSLAIARYSSVDQGPSSGSRCSTMYSFELEPGDHCMIEDMRKTLPQWLFCFLFGWWLLVSL
jgi:hypothetical protein